jgi:two-component system response regulator QseB
MSHILLVEDDLDLGVALQHSLQQAGFEVVWVRRLADVATQLFECKPHCVLLDLNLPDGDGFQLLHELRYKRDAVPVLVLSARGALEDRLKALYDGADDYMLKPFSVPEMIARVNVLIRRANGFSTQHWVVGGLQIDPQAQNVRVGDEVIDLTGREFGILRELAAAAGRVVRRDYISERVWSGESVPSDGAIEFQIHSLRRKLGPDRIKTVRGVGYLLMVSP